MRISTSCYALTGLGYATPWSVNAGFIAGRQTTLIVDTGACALSAATIHGYAAAVRPENRLAAINTERHFDHIGGNSYFRDRGIDVHGHESLRRTEEQFREELDDFNHGIANPARREHREAAAFFHGTRLENPNRAIAADTTMNLGDCEIQIILTPGHTPTNLSVFVPSDGILFCGDCLIGRYLPNLDAGTVSDWRDWLRSLDPIERLKPSVVMPGHGPVATGGDVASMIADVRAVLERAIADGFSPTRRASAG
jgi:glyoxylase-like metal-dependent hydrolase (beta-lactamase superfamily II)